jgi:hypothetical protein
MSNLAKNVRPILFLTTTGLISAVTTIILSGAATAILLPKFVANEIEMGFAGIVYGIAIAVYFATLERLRSIWRPLLFVVVSACAYSAAVFWD